MLSPPLMLSAVLSPASARTKDFVPTTPAWSRQSRHALVIANGTYAHSTDLALSVADARLVTESLRSAGFNVKLVTESGLKEMMAAVVSFRGELSAASAEIALVYYTDHGVQVDGASYLVPVDAEMVEPDHAESQAVALGWLMDQLDAADAGLNVMVMDACRNNPWSRRWGSVFKGSEQAAGLAHPATPENQPDESPQDFYIHFASAPGRKAIDGAYAPRFAEQISADCSELDDVFKGIKQEVERDTGGFQVPFLTQVAGPGTFYFHRSDACGDAVAAIYSEPRPPALRSQPTTALLWSGAALGVGGTTMAWLAARSALTHSPTSALVAANLTGWSAAGAGAGLIAVGGLGKGDHSGMRWGGAAATASGLITAGFARNLSGLEGSASAPLMFAEAGGWSVAAAGAIMLGAGRPHRVAVSPTTNLDGLLIQGWF